MHEWIKYFPDALQAVITESIKAALVGSLTSMTDNFHKQCGTSAKSSIRPFSEPLIIIPQVRKFQLDGLYVVLCCMSLASNDFIPSQPQCLSRMIEQHLEHCQYVNMVKLLQAFLSSLFNTLTEAESNKGLLSLSDWRQGQLPARPLCLPWGRDVFTGKGTQVVSHTAAWKGLLVKCTVLVLVDAENSLFCQGHMCYFDPKFNDRLNEFFFSTLENVP